MHTNIRPLIVASLLAASWATPSFAQHPAMPAGMTHDEHQRQLQKEAELKQRGAAAMGFDQDATSHHFRLTPSGGAIEVGVKNPSDAASLAAVRAHLQEIAGEFARGNFAKPFATHGEAPPGALEMEQRKAALAYTYEETPVGGRVAITASDENARQAVHEFLRYQIREHATGDPLTVPR